VKKLLRRIGGGLLMLLLAAVFYVFVILGDPQEVSSAVRPRMDQPLLTASPAVNIQDASQFPQLLNSFPAPVMQVTAGSGLYLVSASSYDAAFEQGFARVAELVYRDAAEREIVLRSIYPARALALVEKGDYALSGTAGHTLAGLSAVRMENKTRIRLHAQAEDAIYVLEVPKLNSAELVSVMRSLQLAEGE